MKSFTLFLLLVTVAVNAGCVVSSGPIASYELNEYEKQTLDWALTAFRQKVENEKFDEIQNELAQTQQHTYTKDRVVKNIKETRQKFGKPVSSENFGVVPPYSASEFKSYLEGEIYSIYYITQAENKEFSESFSWILNENELPKLLDYTAHELYEWQIERRERDKYLENKYQNRIRIPLGRHFSPIEIRY